MTLNLGLRRFASLSAFLVAMSIASASQAGIIPWAYDVIFGPVRYPAYGYGYSPYAVSYSRPVYVNSAPMYAPASYGYSSGCSTSYYAPVSYAQPNYGCGCAPVTVAPSCGPCGGTVSYAQVGGCLSGCSPSTPAPTTTAPATNGKSAWKKPAEPTKDPAPTPKTFQDPARGGASPAGATSVDGFDTGIRSRGTRTTEGAGTEIETNRPTTTNEEPTILKKTAPTKSASDEFESQLEPVPAKPEEKKFEEPLENKNPTDGNKETTIRRRQPTLSLDAKITWHAEPQRTRVPFHAKLAKASVARRVPSLDSDWTPVVAKSTGTQLVRK